MRRAGAYAVLLALSATGPAVGQTSAMDQRIYSFEQDIPRCIEFEATADALFACTSAVIEACDAIEVDADRVSPNIIVLPCSQEANTFWILMVLREYSLVEQRFNGARYARFPELQEGLKESQQAWDQYRIRQCYLYSRQAVFSRIAEENGRLCQLRLSIERVLQLRRLRGASSP